jgi:7-cyano-7-deazaguanine synthase
MDSATTLAMAGREGFELYALTLRYGQRHAIEVDAARQVAASAGVAEHRVIDIGLGVLGGSALTGDGPVPVERSLSEIGRGIPATYVPARNTVFLAYALAWAEVIGADDIFIGVNAVDYSGYPDCRPEYIEAFERLARLATRAGVQGRKLRIHAPLMRMSKAEIVRQGVELGVDFGLTRTCYDPSEAGEACGRCDACVLRLQGFREAGVIDPVRYRSSSESGT